MLFQMKKILCPIDFSEHAIAGLRRACELAVDYKAELLLLHVVTPVPVAVPRAGVAPASPTVMDVDAHQEELKKNAAKELRKLKKEKIPKDIKTSNYVVVGNEIDSIVEFAENRKVHMIVITTHGRTGLKRLLLGSTAEGIIRHAKQPVLSVRVSE